jgi:hypothetical protein
VYLVVVGVVQGQVHVHGVLVQVHEVVLHGHDAHKIDQDEEGSLILCSCLVVGVIQGQVHVHGVLLQVHGVVAHGHNSQQIGQGGVGSLLCVPGSNWSCSRSISLEPSSKLMFSGVDGQDTSMFLMEKIAPTIETCSRRFVVISWVHTHVRGVKLGFSSIDVHAQYAWSQMFPRAFGLVFELDSRYKYKYDAYVLTDEGKYRVGECSRLHNLSHQQHEACSSESLYKSVKDTIVFTNSDITVVDARHTQPFDAAPSMSFEEIKSNVAAHKQCRACKRPSADDSDLLSHISRKKQCRPAYSERELNEFRAFVKSKRQKSSYSQNKESIRHQQQQYKETHREQINLKQSVYNAKHHDGISQKQSVYDQTHKAEVAKKQAVYNQTHKAEVAKKQAVYNQTHKAEVAKKQAVYDQTHKAEVAKKQNKYDALHKEQIASKDQEAYVQSKRVKNELLVFSLKIQKFKNAIKWGPVFPCMCCHRLMFENGKKEVNRSKFEEKVGKKLFKDSINSTYAKAEQCVLCHTCHHSLIVRKKRPANSYNNGLKFDPVPLALQLTELEQQLIAKTLLFMKVRPLPRSRMDGIIDRVINVPLTDADVANTLASLPRTPDESFLCSVKLKRMQKLKNVHKEALIRPFMLEQALDELQHLGNPHYQNILRQARPDVDILPTIPESEEESSSDSDTDVDGAVNEAINSDFGTCMVPEAPEASVVINTTGTATTTNPNTANEVTLAPGEGKIPNNWLRDPEYEVKGFPTLYPTGQFGLDHERRDNLSTQKYFNQRLLNVDTRCSDSSSWLFAAQQRVEREMLEKQCDIVFQKGKLKKTAGGVSVMQVEDAFAAFQKVRGTPKFWQQARNELVAKVSQLGPFHIFFTLSCGEMRWSEVTTSILQQANHKIEFTTPWNGRDENIFVDGVPLPEFLETQSTSSRSSLLRKNVFLITRIFDHRVKMFIKHMVMKGGKDSLPVQYFTYRVEFQLRGMAHVHGCLWLDEKFIEKYKSPAADGSFDIEKVGELIDLISTCNLPGDSNPELDKIVREVQVHNHSKTCKKYDTECRFDYPHPPSPHTLIATPILDDPTDQVLKSLKSKAREIMTKVKIALQGDVDDNQSLEDFLSLLDVTMNDYLWALSISTRGSKVVLKRTLAERFVNNYNPQYLLAWNANMDIQFCFDTYAVITYICDYYAKDDSGMTEVLTAALRESKGSTGKDKLNILKKAYLSHRQIGACEAVYRLMQNLYLKNSNIKCTFVPTGFPENRSQFMKKVSEDEVDVDLDAELDDDPAQSADVALGQKYQVEGRAGTFTKTISVQERFSARPAALERMCFAQFATLYSVVQKKRKNFEFVDGASEKTGSSSLIETSEPLPLQILLGELGIMTLRTCPAVLRIHASKKKTEAHEFYYAEAMLYFPWRSEIDDLHRNSPQDCVLLFENNLDLMAQNKKAIFPFCDATAEFLHKLETVNPNDIRPAHIYDTLDSEAAQDNLDVADDIDCEEFSIQHPGSFDNIPDGSGQLEKFKYKSIDFSNIDELLYLARQLIPEQRRAFDKVLGFCQKVARQAVARDNTFVPPVRLIIHGGAGSGKSNVIRALSKWAEKTLCKAGDHPNKPRVLLLAPTGMAASIIGGTTMHSAFQLNFGNILSPLTDGKLDEFRTNLADLKLIIIDEMSMVKSDQLYQIHDRLNTIFQSTLPFSGKSVVLVGDLLQLEPVMGNAIFDKPQLKKYFHLDENFPLWEEFEVIVLKHNHRQGEGNEWANTLNRLRVGRIEPDDVAVLQSRQISAQEAKSKESGCNIFYTNAEVNGHNTHKLNNIPGTLFTSDAIVSVPIGCKSFTANTGRVDGTAFMKTLLLKIGARVMLIHNLNVIDELSNGVLGTVCGIKLNDKGQLTCIIVHFDHSTVGIQQRQEYAHISEEYKHLPGTPIFCADFQYQLPAGKSGKCQYTASAKLLQFPLRLAWGVTCHKVQGQTFKSGSPVIINWSKRLTQGMAYVMLGRCENLADLFIAGKFSTKQIRCSDDAMKMSKVLEKRSTEGTSLQDVWPLREGREKFAFLNIRSLSKHLIDISNDSILLGCGLICLAETWLTEGTSTQSLSLLGFNMISVPGGRGKGVAVYSKFPVLSWRDTASESFQILLLELDGLAVLTVYRSQGPNLQELAHAVEELLDRSTQDKILILGDFNFQAGERNAFTDCLRTRGFQQVKTESTHAEGRTIDHCYVYNVPAARHFLHPVYYSDHSALCILLN